MSAYPIAPAQGYLRTPTATEASRKRAYPYDAFGVDTGGRVRPHSGFDATPTVGNATACAVLAGRVVLSGYTIYAGNYVAVQDAWGRLWLYIHLASRGVRPGDWVGEGSAVGIVGNTGGGGALGGGTKVGTHLHVSLCLSLAAAYRIINAVVRARYAGETSEQWAAAHELADPWPIIRDGEGASAPAEPDEPIIERDDDMAVFDETTNTIGWPNGWTASYPRGVFMACRMTEDYARRGEALPADYRFAYDTWLRERWGALNGVQQHQALTLQRSGVLPKDADVAAIAKAVTDELLGARPKAATPEQLKMLAA